MPKKKLIHFEENLTFSHLFQPAYHELRQGFFLKSGWNKNFFHNGHPIILELGCGKGEYTVGLAEKHREMNFIGIDLKGARLWRGCKTVAEKQWKNIAFIRTRVDHIESLFGKDEVSAIWITFPDPQPGKERKRLTGPIFLEKYRKILKPGGIIHLKTDNLNFYLYTLEIIHMYQHRLLFASDDLYQSGIIDDVISIQTYYEKIWLEEGKKICYLKFQLNPS